jgi:mitochondrial fission protein ELM1
VTPRKLMQAAELWRARLVRTGQSLVGVTLGGPNKHQSMSAESVGPLIDGLDRLRAQGARLAITPSRRTPSDVKAAFQTRFAGDPDVFLWDMQGENPYFAILALSDRLVATSDSVSMISEALATPHPVEVFGEDGGPRHAAFLRGLLDRGLVRRFEEPAPLAPRAPLDATETAALAVKHLIQDRLGQARTGASG